MLSQRRLEGRIDSTTLSINHSKYHLNSLSLASIVETHLTVMSLDDATKMSRQMRLNQMKELIR